MKAFVFVLGLIIIFCGVGLMISTALSINPILYFVSMPTDREIIIAEDVGENETNYSISFNFSRNYIYKNFDLSGGSQFRYSYINIYADELKDLNTTQNISVFYVNDNEFIVLNQSYQYSLELEPESLADENQTINIEKTADLNLNKIALNYVGSDYQNENLYSFFMYVFSIALIVTGIGILSKS